MSTATKQLYIGFSLLAIVFILLIVALFILSSQPANGQEKQKPQKPDTLVIQRRSTVEAELNTLLQQREQLKLQWLAQDSYLGGRIEEKQRQLADTTKGRQP